MSEGNLTNTDAALVRAVREFHGLNQEAFAHMLRVSRRTVIRWEQRGAWFSPDWWVAAANTWRELLARYQAAETLRISRTDFSDRNQVRGGEIVNELVPRVVTRVEWNSKKRRAPSGAREEGAPVRKRGLIDRLRNAEALARLAARTQKGRGTNAGAAQKTRPSHRGKNA